MDLNDFNGVQKFTKAKGFRSLIEKNRAKACTYTGKLKGDNDSLVAVTGCAQNNRKEKMYVTMLSSNHSQTTSFFTIDSKGKIEEIKFDGLKDVVVDGDDEEYETKTNGQDYSNGPKDIPKVNYSGTAFPLAMKVNLAFGYDKSIKDKLGKGAEKWIMEVYTHMQILFRHKSLKTKIILEVILQVI